MLYSFRPKGTCSKEMHVEVNEQGIIENLTVVAGCNGNLQGIGALVKGMNVQEVIDRLKGIRCGNRSTSCPDQLAQGLEAFLAEMNQ